MSATMNDDRFLWCDIETFGLDPERHPIIEIGFRLTDLDLNVLGEFHTLIWDEGLHDHWYKDLSKKAASGDKDSAYVLDMHNKSELWIDARANGVSTPAAQEDLLAWMDKYDINGSDPLCGSSVGFDRGFLREQMPEVEKRFHYRIIDNSSTKELCRRYNPRVYSKLDEETQPKKTHRVMSDLDDTINEFRFYRDNFLWVEL